MLSKVCLVGGVCVWVWDGCFVDFGSDRIVGYGNVDFIFWLRSDIVVVFFVMVVYYGL